MNSDILYFSIPFSKYGLFIMSRGKDRKERIRINSVKDLVVPLWKRTLLIWVEVCK